MRGDQREQSHQTHIAESVLPGHKEPIVAQCNDGVVGEVRGTAQVDHPLPIQKGKGHAHVGVVCTADKHKLEVHFGLNHSLYNASTPPCTRPTYTTDRYCLE